MQQGYGYPQQRNSSYRYQGPSTAQYESFFNPIPIDFLQQNLAQHQGQYDQAFAGALAAKEAAAQQEIALGDEIYRNQLVDQSMQEMDKLAEQYGGDYGRAAKGIARKVTDLRSDPFWNTSKYLKEQQSLQQKFQLANPDSHIYNDVMKMGAVDAEGNIRNSEDLTFQGRERLPWLKNLNDQVTGLEGDQMATVLANIGIEGMGGVKTVKDLSDTDIKTLAYNEAFIESFKQNNPDFAESKEKIDGMKSDEINKAAGDFIYGNLMARKGKKVSLNPFKLPTDSSGSDSLPKTPIPGQPRLVKSDKMPFGINDDTLRLRRKGSVSQILNNSITSDHIEDVKASDPEKYQSFINNTKELGNVLKESGLNFGDNNEVVSSLVTKIAEREDQKRYGFDRITKDLVDEGYVEIDYGGKTDPITYTFPQTGQTMNHPEFVERIRDVYESEEVQNVINNKDYINSFTGEETFNSNVFTPVDKDTRDDMFAFTKDVFIGLKSNAEIRNMGLEVYKNQGTEVYDRNKSRMNNKVDEVLKEIQKLSAGDMESYRIGVLPGDTNDKPRIVINTPSGDQLRIPMTRDARPLLEVGVDDNPLRRIISEMETPELINNDIDYTVDQFLNKVSSNTGVPLKDILGGGSQTGGQVYRRGPEQYEFTVPGMDTPLKGRTPSELLEQIGVDNKPNYMQQIMSKYATSSQKQRAASMGITNMEELNMVLSAFAAQQAQE